MAKHRGYTRGGTGGGRHGRHVRMAQATLFNLPSALSGEARMAHKSAKLDAKRILEQMSDLDRVRFIRWLELCDAYDLEMPPPLIADIIQRARERLKLT